MTDVGLENADKKFGEAVDAIKGATDPFGQLQTGYTYEVWALATAPRRDEVDQDKIAKAFECYRAAGARGYPYAEDSIKALQKRLQSNASQRAAEEFKPGQATNPVPPPPSATRPTPEP